MSLLVAPTKPSFTAAPDYAAAFAGTFRFCAIDYFTVAAYSASFLLNLLTAPVDAELTFTFKRDPRFLERRIPALLSARLQRWHIIQLLKCATLLLGLFAVCLACWTAFGELSVITAVAAKVCTL
jgi:hypothetical protein